MKGFVCTLPSGGQYKDVNGATKFARYGAPIVDVDEKYMYVKTKDEKGHDKVDLRYGFETLKVETPSTSTAATARAMKKMANENNQYKAELDALRAEVDELKTAKVELEELAEEKAVLDAANAEGTEPPKPPEPPEPPKE